MGFKITLTTFVVIAAVFAYYATIPVPADLSSYDSSLVRVLAFAMDMNTFLRSLPTNAHIHLSNFAWGISSDLMNIMKPDDPSINYTDMRVEDVKIRLYEPVDGEGRTRAGLIYFHGGGMMYGDTEIFHVFTHHLAAELDVVLVSVDYRLSWQRPFPAAINDCTKATVWFMRHAKDYNVDPNRIAVGGDSAGGNLAAAVAGRLTFNKEYSELPKLKFHAVIYPGLQASDFKTPSNQQHGNKAASLITTEFICYCYSHYLLGNSELKDAMTSNYHTSPDAKKNITKLVSHHLLPVDKSYKPSTGKAYGNVKIFENIADILLNPDFAPLMRHNLAGLPPAYIVTVEEDPARDDGIIYARRLEDAGVDVTWRNYKKGVHGMFLLFVDPISIEAGKQSVQDFIEFARIKLT